MPAYSGAFDKALVLASIVHEGVSRKGTVIPYIAHPLHVARLLEQHGFPERVSIAGLLHDVLEDAEFGSADLQDRLSLTFAEFAVTHRSEATFRTATESFIEEAFGAAVLHLVQSVTEQKTEGSELRDWRTRKDEQVGHIRGLEHDSAALKAADALHNVQSVLREVRSEGLIPLAKFNCSIGETLWYYGAVADGLRDVLRDHPRHAELDQAVLELTVAVDALLGEDVTTNRCLFCGQSHEHGAHCMTEKPSSDFAVIGGDGRRIRSLARFHVAPPVGRARQWVTGRSARETARAWSGLRVPDDVLEVIRRTAELSDFRPKTAFAELVTPLDDFGEGRNHDVVVLGVAHGKRVLVGIEAKSDEELGPRISDCLSQAEAKNDDLRSRGRTRLSRVPERIEQLRKAVFPEGVEGLSSMRYQLLHGLAGTLIEARSRGADVAVFLVHEFLSGDTDMEKVRRNEADFDTFAAALKPAGGSTRDGLIGPIVPPKGTDSATPIPYYLGLVTTHLTGSPSPVQHEPADLAEVATCSRADAIAFGIQAYQDYTFIINDRADRRLDDEQLLADWRAAFPNAKGKVFTAGLPERLEIIRGVRRDYNKGVENHGHRNLDGTIAGPARRLSLPYRGGQTYSYSERWLKACERAGTRAPRA
jgi:hypothetical protein